MKSQGTTCQRQACTGHFRIRPQSSYSVQGSCQQLHFHLGLREDWGSQETSLHCSGRQEPLVLSRSYGHDMRDGGRPRMVRSGWIREVSLEWGCLGEKDCRVTIHILFPSSATLRSESAVLSSLLCFCWGKRCFLFCLFF